MARRSAEFDGLKEVRSAAFQLFGRYGYDGVSIEAIAKSAGTSKSALYWHFKNKQALFLDCLQELQHIYYGHIFEPMTRSDDPRGAMILLFNGALKLLRDPRIQQGIAGYWLEAGSITPQEVLESHQAFNKKIISVLEDVLQAGAEQGAFHLEEPVKRLAKTIVSTLEALMLPLRGQTLSEKDELVGVLAGIMFRAHLQDNDLAKQAVELIYIDLEEST